MKNTYCLLLTFFLLLTAYCLPLNAQTVINPRRALVINPPVGGGGYNAIAQTYFDYGGFTLADSQKTNISEWCDCIDDTLNAGARNKTIQELGFIRFWWFVNGDSVASKTDFATGELITNNGTTWTQWDGFLGNGTSTYLNLNFVPSTEGGTIFVQNSASFGLGTPTARAGGTGYYNGVWKAWINPRYGSSGTRMALNGPIWIEGVDHVSNGHHFLSRTTSTLMAYTRNNGTEDTDAGASQTLPAYTIYLGALNDNGAGVLGFDALRFYYYFAGKGFTSTERRGIVNCNELYLDGIGKGLIP